jgi:hypothetical protein
MKTSIFYSLLLFCFLTSCSTILKDLPRNNPLDANSQLNIKNGVAIKCDSYYIYSENNGDKLINPGETVRINISLNNYGFNVASDIKATFSSTSKYLASLSPTSQISYGDIISGSSSWFGKSQKNFFAIEFNVLSSTPINTIIPINIKITDVNGNTWISKVDIKIEKLESSVIYNDYSLNSDNNGDNTINKGETIKLNVELRNEGESKVKGLKTTFTTTSTYITGYKSTANLDYYDISPGYTSWYNGNKSFYNVIEFTVKTTTPDNTIIPITVSMVDESGNTWTSSFNLTVVATKALITYNDYSLNSDNNGDNTINKGETIKLNVELRNEGESKVKGLKTTFTTTSTYITGYKSTANLDYYDISPGYTSWYNGNKSFYNVIEFTVKTTTPDNTIIPITVSMVDESGNTWTSSFNLTVVATKALITYNDYSLNSDNNGDNTINKGETIKLNVELRNEGESKVKGLKTTFTTTSTYITGYKSTANLDYYDISPGYTSWYNGNKSFYNVIEFTVKTTTPDNTIIPIKVSMVDESGNKWTSSFDLVVLPLKLNSPVYNLDFNKKFNIKSSLVEKNILDYRIFPNPVNDVMNIRFIGNEEEKINLILFDYLGRVILTMHDLSTEEIHKIDMSNFSKGEYIVKIFLNNIVYHDKFILN